MKKPKDIISKLLLAISITTLSCLLFSSCSDDNSTGPDNNTTWGENKGTFNVTWSDDVIAFTGSDLKDITRIDSANFIFYINPTSSKAQLLESGKIIRIGDWMLRRVYDVYEVGNELVVETEFVSLTEAAKDADISWDYGVEYKPLNVITTLRKNGYDIQALSLDSFAISFKLGSFTISGWLKFLSDRARFNLTIDKAVADVSLAKMIVEGEFKRFRSHGDIQVRDHQLTRYDTDVTDQDGVFTVKVVAGGSGDDIGIEIPFPLVVGPLGIPFFTFEIKFLGIINSTVPPGASTLMEEKFVYKADQGFKYVPKSNTGTPYSSLKDFKFEGDNKNQHAASPSIIQVAWGLAVPRFEVLFMGTTVGWFHTAYLLDGYYRFNPACQQVKAHFYGACGWAIGALTATIYSKSYNLWDQKKVIVKAGDCPD